MDAIAQIIAAENGPADQEGQNPIDMRQEAQFLCEAGKSLDEEQEEIEKSPAEEGPIRPVPESCQRPHGEEIEHPPRLAAPVSAQGKVHIVPEPGAQGHVPAAPEFGGASGNIGIVEVFREFESEHFSQTDGHVRVAGEIKINLQRVRQRAEPGGGHGEGHAGAENVIRHLRHIVGNQNLLRQAIDEALHAVAKVRQRLPAVHDLLLDGVVADDRAGDELREERDVEAHIPHTLLRLRLAVVNVKEIGQELEGEERNPDGEGNVDPGEIFVQQKPQLLRQEGKVLEYDKHAHMKACRHHQDALLPLLSRRFYLAPGEPADDDG